MTNGKYEIPLPMKEKLIIVPDSEPMTFERLQRLRRKFKDDENYKQYKQFMINLLEKWYAEEVPTCDVRNQQVWYIPHFGLRHPTKSIKVRVIFECAARVNDLSLNDMLRQGPDISNPLLGVLLRFRLGLHAYIADRENMYYQVRVPENDKDYLTREFWLRGQLEYLPCLQERQKWLKVNRDLKEGDVVLMVENNTPRSHWLLAQVVRAIDSKDGLIR
ncbi:uncharacterized protein LOC143025813 [Oratosquilla oratoria]|uniref:uncharacterized protein LOC143025813 n=1 Tax=Oratosquilla oratoria TaxID=337810 RepID=UPI003F75A259